MSLKKDKIESFRSEISPFAYFIFILMSFGSLFFANVIIYKHSKKTITIERNQIITPDEIRINQTDTVFVYKISF